MRRWWRWIVVVGLAAGLVTLPAVVGAWPVHATAVAPGELAARILGSAATPYHGLATVRGGIPFPDVGVAEDQLALLGETSKLRAWYAAPQRWRVDDITTSGEHDMYAGSPLPEGFARQGNRRRLPGATVITWDSQSRRVGRLDNRSQVRLPWSFDLLPPELGRRLLHDAAPSELSSIDPVRVGGRVAVGVRIVPAGSASTIARADIWADASTGVVLRVDVISTVTGKPALESRFLEVSLTRPSESTITFVAPPGARISQNADPRDLVQQLASANYSKLPDTVDGLRRRTTGDSPVSTYGEGLTAVAIGALPNVLVPQGLQIVLPLAPRPWGGQARVLPTALLNVMLVTKDGTTYAIVGLVNLETLDRVAVALLSTDGAK
ncbi:MAG: hypothetical protein JWL70_2324 [Acidimicrobiia bacterium]|nr:hypothetical protein [Acidimicrobiia bacterium]